MLRWRLLIGAPLVLFVAFICWVDAIAPFPGVALMPFFLVCSFFLCREILRLLNAGGVFPRRSTVYVGVIGTILLSWISSAISTPHLGRLELATAESARRVEISDLAGNKIGEVVAQAYDTTEEWRVATYGCFHVLLAIAAGVLIAFVGEMFRYRQPGGPCVGWPVVLERDRIVDQRPQAGAKGAAALTGPAFQFPVNVLIAAYRPFFRLRQPDARGPQYLVRSSAQLYFPAFLGDPIHGLSLPLPPHGRLFFIG